MAAAKENLTIRKGATFEKTWIYADSTQTPISLAGMQARMQVRERINDADPAIIDLTSSPAAGITIEADASIGQIDIRIGADVTDTLSFDRGVYDLEIYDPLDVTEVKVLVGGSIILVEGVTR